MGTDTLGGLWNEEHAADNKNEMLIYLPRSNQHVQDLFNETICAISPETRKCLPADFIENENSTFDSNPRFSCRFSYLMI